MYARRVKGEERRPGLCVAGQRTELQIGGSRQPEGAMTEDKKKPEENQVSEEDLKDVSGGMIDIPTAKKKVAEPLDKSMEREGTIENSKRS